MQGENITIVFIVSGLCPQPESISTVYPRVGNVCLAYIHVDVYSASNEGYHPATIMSYNSLIYTNHQTCFLQLRLTVNETSGPWWRPLPKPQECSVITARVRPGLVDVDSIVPSPQVTPLPQTADDDGSRTLDSFELSWDPPADPFGEILSYDIYVGPRLLQPLETSGFITSTVSKHGQCTV